MAGIDDLEIDGSVVDGPFQTDLILTREYLKSIKDHKLWARHEKNKRMGIVSFRDVYIHLLDEAKEFQEGLEVEDIDNLLEELADMSNCIDILATMLWRVFKK